MRCLLDVRFARPGALDGVGRFLWCAAPAAARAMGSDGALTLLCHEDDAHEWRAQVPTARVFGTEVPIASLAQHAAWPRLIAALGVDVAHYPQYDLPPLPASTAAVATIYDFTPLDEPTYFGPGRRLRALAAAALMAGTSARAAVVTTLSHATANEAQRRLPGLRRAVQVTTPGPPRIRDDATRAPPPPRFVYVGNHRPHKRVELLLRAFARLRERVPAARLSLFGRSDPRFPAVGLMLATALGAGVRLVEGATDAEVADAVGAARALAFPSVGEGYGFPVVEALALGTPALVADAGSLPEVLGGAGVIVPPSDEGALAAALYDLATDDDLWRSCSERARGVIAGLSWRASGEQLVKAWRIAANGHGAAR